MRVIIMRVIMEPLCICWQAPRSVLDDSDQEVWRGGCALLIITVVVTPHAVLGVAKDFLTDLAVTFQSAALGLRRGFARRLAFLDLPLLLLRDLTQGW